MTSVMVRYLEANLLVLVGFVLLRLIHSIGLGRSKPFSYTSQLLLARLFLVCVLLVPLGTVFIPKQSYLSPSAQIWHASSMRNPVDSRGIASVVTIGEGTRSTSLSSDAFSGIALIVVISILLAFIFRFGGAFLQLRRMFHRSFQLRRIGRTSVRIADGFNIPFSFWTPQRAYVFLPNQMLENPAEFLIAVQHENQHHRQRDTQWSYVYEFFRCLFILNPAFHLIIKHISEIQEFACDGALIQKKSVSPHAYGGCLLRVAETARVARAVLVGTTCMAGACSGSFLKRRIEYMLNLKTKRYLGKSASVMVGLAGVMLITTVAWAAQGFVQDRRVTLQEAIQLADVARKNSNFPVTVNEAVVKELNRFVGTPDGREFIKNALARMENYRLMVERKLDEYGLPREIMALPIMESGYKNSPQSPKPQYAAGVWQFIPETARNYGLVVNPQLDERLNVEQETDAACRYLGSLNYRFQNWELAILSYNAGEGRIQKGISKLGTKSAWTLIQNGFAGDDGYLAKMMAAVIILKSPSIVE